MRWAFATDPGRVRRRNEDACDVFPLPSPAGGQVLVVADGLGGHADGDVASRLAVALLRQQLEGWAGALTAPPALEEAGAQLVRAVRRCNQAIVSAADSAGGMYTTLTAALVLGEGFAYAHVGDSRLYRIGRDGLRQLTRDHGLAAELARQAGLSPEQLPPGRHRHVLTQALGLDQDLDIDAGLGRLEPGEGLMLCTDGLTGVVPDEEIWQVLQSLPVEEAVRRLVALANERGGPDNVTVAVALPVARPGEAEGLAS